jgi:starch-binding outer membrane protein, SusD/RagB family
MKNIKKIYNYFYSFFTIKTIGFFSLTLVFTLCMSCDIDELLQEEPKAIAAELFYNTEEELKTGLNSIYQPMSQWRAEYIVVNDTHTDWGYGRGSRANYNDLAGFNSGKINVAGQMWNAFYLSIRNANIFIKNAEAVEGIGEAKYLRALAYFDLVRSWGGVPIRTDLNIDEKDAEKSTPSEVYALIEADLLDAEATLPADPSDIGRPSKYAATLLLADVYLTLGRYAEASAKANDVIKSNKFSLVPTTSIEDFQFNLYGPDQLTSSEEIFSFKYTRQNGFGNWILFILNSPLSGLYNFGGAYAHYGDAVNPFFTSWDGNDLRKALWDQIDFGLGATTLVSKKYIDNAAVSVRGAGNDLPVYRYAEALLIYAEAVAMAGGPTADAMEALNQVHRRAFGVDPKTPSAVDFDIADYDADSFVDLVLQERAYEFIFEGKRWFDLRRTGTAAQTILDAKGITIAEKAYLWPIPTYEIDFNDLMGPEDQNPGY